MKFTKYILEKYKEKKRKNQRYSLRAFSKLLGVSSGRLSEILEGKSGVTKNTVLQIAKNLKLDQIETQKILQYSIIEFSKNKNEIKKAKSNLIKLRYQKLEPNHDDIYNVLSEWHHFAILELTHLEKLKLTDYKKISEIFDIDENEIKLALERLLRCNLLKIDSKNFIKDNMQFLETPDGIPNKAIRECHKSLLLRAINSLESQSVEMRDSKAIILSINPEDISFVKKEVDAFLDLLAKKLNKSRSKSKIYSMNFNFFDLMKQDRTP